MTEIDIGNLKDKEISVLMGGWSAERDISLKTGKAVLDSIKQLGLNAKGLDLAKKYSIPYKFFSSINKKKFERNCLFEIKRKKINFLMKISK